MDQPSGTIDAPPRSGVNFVFLIAGLAQILAAFTPAGHARLLGAISFIRLPQAGIAFVVLGALTVLVAVRPRGWWRWIPGLASAALLAVVYARLRWQPTGGFADPLVRRMVRPDWGFYPMGSAIVLALAMAAFIPFLHRSRSAPAQLIPAPDLVSEEAEAVELIPESDLVSEESEAAEPVPATDLASEKSGSAEPIPPSDSVSEESDPAEPILPPDPASEESHSHSTPTSSPDVL